LVCFKIFCVIRTAIRPVRIACLDLARPTYIVLCFRRLTNFGSLRVSHLLSGITTMPLERNFDTESRSHKSRESEFVIAWKAPLTYTPSLICTFCPGFADRSDQTSRRRRDGFKKYTRPNSPQRI
jgi:hypothetical protein